MRFDRIENRCFAGGLLSESPRVSSKLVLRHSREVNMNESFPEGRVIVQLTGPVSAIGEIRRRLVTEGDKNVTVIDTEKPAERSDDLDDRSPFGLDPTALSLAHDVLVVSVAHTIVAGGTAAIQYIRKRYFSGRTGEERIIAEEQHSRGSDEGGTAPKVE
jgi:hypothetical protein